VFDILNSSFGDMDPSKLKDTLKDLNEKASRYDELQTENQDL